VSVAFAPIIYRFVSIMQIISDFVRDFKRHAETRKRIRFSERKRFRGERSNETDGRFWIANCGRN